MTVAEFPSSDGKECAILRIVRSGLADARTLKMRTPKEKATFIENRLRGVGNTEFNLAASLLSGIMEDETVKCSECGKEK